MNEHLEKLDLEDQNLEEFIKDIAPADDLELQDIQEDKDRKVSVPNGTMNTHYMFDEILKTKD